MATHPVNLPQGYKLDSGLPEGYTLDEENSISGAFGRGALDALPFGTKGAAALEAGVGEGKYKDYLDELDKLMEADEAQHPIARTAGEITGAVAPFMIPGVGEALGAETLAGRAGIGAGIGALQGASNTRADLTSPEGLKDIAMGAGTGAVLNPAIGKLGDIISGGAGKLAPKLEDIANSKTVQSMGIPSGKLGVPSEDIQNMGNLAHEIGADTGSLEERYNTLKDAVMQTGNQIGDLGEGKTLLNTEPYIENLHNHLKESTSVFGAEANPEATLYRQALANLQTPTGEGIPFEHLQSLKNAVADRAFDRNGNITNQAAFNVYKTYSDALESLATDHPEYPDLKKAYSVLKNMKEGIEGQFQKEQATGIQARGFGMAGKMAGMVTGGNPMATGATAAGLTAMGHPFMGLGAATTLLTNPEAMAAGARSASGALSGLANSNLPTAALTNISGKELAHHAMLHTASEGAQNTSKIPPQYAPVFQKAIQGIQDPAEKQKQMTITDFVLQSRDPNYSKAKKDMGNEEF